MPGDPRPPDVLRLEVDGRVVTVPDDGGTLLDALRDHAGVRSAKDGCSPQGQCGCCTVLVDGAARVACVTPARRVVGRSVTTLDGFDPVTRQAWADACSATGASQCGFCTPGIIVRLEGLRAREGADASPAAVERALQAHLCRCTGWLTIGEAWQVMVAGGATPARDLAAAARRAGLEGRNPQRVGPEVALGQGGFAADEAPADALVAVPDGQDGWVVAETLAEARRRAGKVQGRRSSVEARPPLDLPSGEWARTLRTSWVEPAYLETDASWCAPGGTPASPLANGGAFGAKRDTGLPAVARELADRHGRAVLVLRSREDCVRRGPKRPPVAAGVRPDGTGVIRVVRTPGIAAAIASVAPGLVVEELDVAGPPTSASLRGAGWVEAAVVLAGLAGLAPPPAPVRMADPTGGWAEATVDPGGRIRVRVGCGAPLDEVVVRSYAIGAAHMALSWVTSEALAVDEAGEIHDLTIRSFGVVRAVDMVPVDVTIEPSTDEPVNGSDAVFAAVAAAVWRHQGCPPDWPTRRQMPRSS